ncbi:hypothetical protein A2973_00945 [Candidatus Gottesmanbacteria bacterium RIFCSPLOWO2_01_FULL_49_10]|uniref:Uncharacterized protein n=1 Tax=Candidatus Gottesmanbacteria bacterium RIFCSPLOWO2_01_FULL_49_10 TaxID=1798396 RepID=A0A1F6AWD1_9BACT|nr:MAG: hypothetical protein A2973_00945 [Candidatus Gottesmanbacteria bacterium RIFCSPLOWO2_01_FULL_49_10]
MVLLGVGQNHDIDVPIPKRHVAPQAIQNGVVGPAVNQHIPTIRETDVGPVSLTHVTEDQV